jgi:hypothetical protein
VDGRTIRDELVQRGRPPWPEAVEIAAQIAQGLAAAYGQVSARLAYRDRVKNTDGRRGGELALDIGQGAGARQPGEGAGVRPRGAWAPARFGA